MDLPFRRPDYSFELFVIALWIFPIGAYVMRRHFADAHGVTRVVKWILNGLALLCAPLAILLTILVFVWYVLDSLQTLGLG